MATMLVIFLNKRLEVSLNMGLYLLNPQSLHVVRLAEDITQGQGRGQPIQDELCMQGWAEAESTVADFILTPLKTDVK